MQTYFHFPNYLEISEKDSFYQTFYDFIESHLQPQTFIIIVSNLLTAEIKLLYPKALPTPIDLQPFTSIASILEYYRYPHLTTNHLIGWKSTISKKYQYLIILECRKLSFSELWEYCNVLFTDFVYHSFLFEDLDFWSSSYHTSYLAQLNDTLEEVKEKLNYLKSASSNLHQQLQRSQKMIVIGEIAPIVADALAKPMESIEEYCELLNNNLPLLIVQIPHLLQKFNTQEEKLFWELIDKISNYPPPFDQPPKTSNPTFQSVIQEKLIGLNIIEYEERFLDIFHASHLNKTLYLLEKIKVFWQNINHIRKSIEKVFEILSALEQFTKSATTVPILVDLDQTLNVVLLLYNFYFAQGIVIEKDLSNFPKIHGYPQLLMQMWVSLCWHCFMHISYQGKLSISALKKNDSKEILGIAIHDKSLSNFHMPTSIPQVISLERCNAIILKHGGLLHIQKENNQMKFSIFFED
ncbi:MAG: hypothetical protein RML72_08905 [Bacteroidia bacterium]|nr:hypothetical protein [Bacteroidia bacterium]MDW8158974.1 hypothetical protein [Bacteroidia bacterium]